MTPMDSPDRLNHHHAQESIEGDEGVVTLNPHTSSPLSKTIHLMSCVVFWFSILV